MFFLFNIIVSIVVSIIAGIIRVPILPTLYTLAVLIPSLALLSRRLHDTGRSAWWILVGLIPFAGAVVLLIFAVLDSQARDNKHGANPKGASSAPTSAPNPTPAQ